MSRVLKTARIGKRCVACGCCVQECPRGGSADFSGDYGEGGQGAVRRLREVREGLPCRRNRHGAKGGAGR